jgi:hypothetical protein
MDSIEQIIRELKLVPHPEGGYYRETYRSKMMISEKELGKPFEGSRNVSTCIYFLLTKDVFSAFHKINQDEIWHFYDGNPIHLHMISPEGEYSCVTIGRDFSKGEVPQYMVPAGYWFGSRLAENKAYSLLGCTVSPGFDFKDFDLPSRNELTDRFPQHSKIIQELTRV